MDNLQDESFVDMDFFTFKLCPICHSTNLTQIGTKNTIHPLSNFRVSLLRCNFCKHWHTEPMPTSDLLSKLYAKSSLFVLGEGWAEITKASNTKDCMVLDSHWIVKELSHSKPANLLEIGPGPGNLLRKMRSFGWNAYGVDLGSYASGFQVVPSLKQLPKSILFDVIVLQDVLEHVSNPSDFLKDYLPYLKSDVTLFMTVPWSESRTARKKGTSWEMVRPLGHLHYFSKNSANMLLESIGFKTVTMRTVNIYRTYCGTYWRSLLFSLLALAHGLIRPSRWNSLIERSARAWDTLKDFPGDPEGDQLYLIAQRMM